MEEVTRVKMAKFRHDLHSQIRQVMKKYIEIEEEVLVRLVEGKCVGGSLCRDKWTGVIMFKAYNRQPRKRQKDQLVKKLPWGWVKESAKKLKVFGSFPKEYSTATVIGMLEEHTKDAKDALIDKELDLIEFC